MLFEKFLRKRKIPPYYLELIMASIYIAIILNGFAFCVGWYEKAYSETGFMIGIHIFVTIGSIITALVTCFPVTGLVFILKKDRKKHRIIENDVRFIIYTNIPINIPAPGTPGWNTFLGYNFKEPFMQIIYFDTCLLSSDQAPPLPIKLYIPAVYFSYHDQEDYKAIKYERKATKAEAKKYWDDQCDYDDDPDFIGATMYMTYTKMKVLNRLFELVNPPEFHITTYEKSTVFISIEPIPGREYPQEALECMEKINAMYP